MLFIVTPTYNVEDTIEITARSVFGQSDSNFTWVVIDDCSTDSTLDRLRGVYEKFFCGTQKLPNFHLMKTAAHGCSLKSIKQAIYNWVLDDQDIVCILDGDDWLYGNCVETIKKTYEETGCWMTHGSYRVHPHGNLGEFSFQYPNRVLENGDFRKYQWGASHMRTFKYGLWRRIDQNDFLDKNGNVYTMTGDLAMTFPMLEMAREHVSFISKPIYVYNSTNPLNDHKIDNRRQIEIEKEIRSKPKYERLMSL